MENNISALDRAEMDVIGYDLRQPPGIPVNALPADGAKGVSLTPQLIASSFQDPEIGATQAAAQWVIFRPSDGSVIWDSGSDTSDLASVTVPSSANLTSGTAYQWKVRYEDNRGSWSDYSAPTAFTTLSPQLSVAPATCTYGGTTTLRATLTAGAAPLAGRTINFALQVGGTLATAVTDVSGVATLALSLALKQASPPPACAGV